LSVRGFLIVCLFFFFQAEDGIRDFHVTGVQTCALPIFFLMGTFALMGYMELRHEVERITSETALVTNHLTGEVRQCNTRGNGNWNCRAVAMQARHWIFALIPFWPARDHLVNDLHVHPAPADEAAFLSRS